MFFFLVTKGFSTSQLFFFYIVIYNYDQISLSSFLWSWTGNLHIKKADHKGKNVHSSVQNEKKTPCQTEYTEESLYTPTQDYNQA